MMTNVFGVAVALLCSALISALFQPALGHEGHDDAAGNKQGDQDQHQDADGHKGHHHGKKGQQHANKGQQDGHQGHDHAKHPQGQ